MSLKKQELKYYILTRDRRYKKEFNEMKMLGPSISYLPKMYYFLFFFINQVNLSYPHLLDYLPLMSHNHKPILSIYL